LKISHVNFAFYFLPFRQFFNFNLFVLNNKTLFMFLYKKRILFIGCDPGYEMASCTQTFPFFSFLSVSAIMNDENTL